MQSHIIAQILILHGIPCPECGATVGMCPKGTKEFCLTSKAEIERIKRAEALKPNCPVCNSKMEIREGYSKFWGCPNYPKCREIIPIENEVDD